MKAFPRIRTPSLSHRNTPGKRHVSKSHCLRPSFPAWAWGKEGGRGRGLSPGSWPPTTLSLCLSPHPFFIGSLLLPGLNLSVRVQEGILTRVARGPRSWPFSSPLSAVTHLFPSSPPNPCASPSQLNYPAELCKAKGASFQQTVLPLPLTYTCGLSFSSLEKNSYVETDFLCFVQCQSLRTWRGAWLTVGAQ